MKLSKVKNDFMKFYKSVAFPKGRVVGIYMNGPKAYVLVKTINKMGMTGYEVWIWDSKNKNLIAMNSKLSSIDAFSLIVKDVPDPYHMTLVFHWMETETFEYYKAPDLESLLHMGAAHMSQMMNIGRIYVESTEAKKKLLDYFMETLQKDEYFTGNLGEPYEVWLVR